MYLQDDKKANAVVRWLNDNGYRRTVKGQEKASTSDFVKGILKNCSKPFMVIESAKKEYTVGNIR